MGQKVSPHGLRVGVIKDWDSKWYAGKKNFADYLVEDNKVREFVKKELYEPFIAAAKEKLVKPKEEEPQQQEEPPEIRRKNKYLEVLNESADNPVFRSEIEVTKEHIEQIQTRLQKLNDILTSHFKPHEMTYKRFKNIIEDAATRFYANVKTMVKRINIFDTKDYFRISDGNVNMSVSARQERLKIYTEHINYVKKIVEANENIISKLSRLKFGIFKIYIF